MTTAYPLAWPDGWPRTPHHKREDSRGRFKRAAGPWTFAAARESLTDELGRLGARHMVLSTNWPLRRDGLPLASGPKPDDQGVAVYFELKGRPMVMACDAHQRSEENMRSIALALDAMRALERHGGGSMMERAFTGFAALPAPNAKIAESCWSILGLPHYATEAEVRAAWRERVKTAGENGTAYGYDQTALNVARDQCLSALAVRNAQ